MRLFFYLAVLLTSATTALHSSTLAVADNQLNPIVRADVVLQEKDGLLVAEAEHFVKQTQTNSRAFSMREDGFEFDKWLMTMDRDFQRPADIGPENSSANKDLPGFPRVTLSPTPKTPPTSEPQPVADDRDRSSSPTKPVSSLPLILPRQPDGDGSVSLVGESKVWHKITLTMDGPFAHEQDNAPNPFLDYRLEVEFQHTDGTNYKVPGYFAADGNAAQSSAQSGTKWRAHFAPDREGRWNYVATLVRGDKAAIEPGAPTSLIDKSTGQFQVDPSDKTGRDFRAQGRLQYVGQHYLQHMGSKKYFLKAGADAPETLLGYADFDGTVAGKTEKGSAENILSARS